MKFHSPGMYSDIKNYCASFISCNKRKTSAHLKPAPLQRFQAIQLPFELCSIDIVGPLPTTLHGNKYLLTFTDYFTKYVEAIPIPDQKADTIACAFVEKIIVNHGVPQKLLTDRGANLIGKIMKEVCEILHIPRLQTTSYHAPTNGQIERWHKTFGDIGLVSHYVNKAHTDWDQFVPFALLAYRSVPHASTGETPFFLTHGRDIDLPFDDIITPTRTRYDTEFTTLQK